MESSSSFARSLGVCLFVLLFFGCSGGGCSGCTGCGVQPIPGGFPIADRIENSAQVRLTESGIQFIEDNADAIVASFMPDGLEFPVPRMTGSTTGVDYTVCPDGNCVVHGEIDSMDLTPQAPNRLNAHIRVVLDSRDAAGGRAGIPVDLESGCVFGVCLIDTTCRADIDTRRGSRPYVGLVADLDFVAETRAARAGYTKLVVSSIALAPGEDLQNDDIDLPCSGIAGAIIGLIIDLLKGTVIGMLQDQISGALDGAFDDQLCTTRGEYGCPTGTVEDGPDPGDMCRFTAGGECVPILLGTDGQGDLGASFLGGTSPGTHAPGQFLLASGGDGEAVNNGMSLFFYGGFRGTDRSFMTSPAHNPCVPLVEPPPLPTIPRIDTFRGNMVPGGAASHVGIGLSEQYLNYTGYGIYDSGMLCLGVGTRLSQQISTGLFSLLIMSLKNLAFPEAAAPVSLALRPQAPPVFEIGAGTADEPLLLVTLPNMEIDFYVWSTERYIRFMTYRATLTIPVNLTVDAGEIVPMLGEIGAADSSVSNSDLLEEDPAALATLIEGVIRMFAGMLGGSVSPIALPDLMGFLLEVPDGGIQGFEEGGDEWLGIFANLALAPPMGMVTGTADTSATLEELRVDPRVLALDTFGQGEIPWARIRAEADGPLGAEYEYGWRIDGMQWQPWTRDPDLRVQDRALLFQARHVVEVRARMAGARGTEDRDPARVEVLVDALAPDVQADRLDGGVRVRATDIISPLASLEYRWRQDGSDWSVWEHLETGTFIPVGFDDAEVDVEVRDEAGNVGATRAALIRGLPDPEAGSGCGCEVPGRNGASPIAGLVLLGLLGIALGRRRGRDRRYPRRRGRLMGLLSRLGLVIVLPLALGAAGCDCGSDGPPCGGPCARAGMSIVGAMCCPSSNMCVDYDREAICDPGFVCPDENVEIDGMCAFTCSACERKPALEPGLLATDLDMAIAPDGTIVVSGYSPGVPPSRQYGDLVIGAYDPSSSSVGWEIVDGAPSSPISNDPDGWRNGVGAAGDDVGRWTSIVENGGVYYVSYYDRTNGALKLATGRPGAWNTQIVDGDGDSGRYSSIVLDSAGNPAIAYLRMKLAEDGSGVVNSSVQVARASSPSPASPSDWVITEVATSAMACRPGMCGARESCLENGQCVVPTADCASDCGTGSVCFMTSCEAELADPYVEDMPPAYGMYDSLAVTSAGLALVFYDRTAGNIMGASFDGSAWGAPFLIDGYGVGDPDVGDSGIGATVAVDAAGVWHVAYVDGAEENLRYATVTAGVATTEVVDDGSTDGTGLHPDGRHIVGDDASLVVTDGGEIRVAYQDATTQRVMFARRPATGGAWAIEILDMDDHTGFWVEQLLAGTTSYVATFWRNETGTKTNGVRVLTRD